MYLPSFLIITSLIIYVRIMDMDKLIKSIAKSGSFRAYVLDSTETVRTAQEEHQQTMPT